MKPCVQCRQPLSDNASFCRNCGAPQPPQRHGPDKKVQVTLIICLAAVAAAAIIFVLLLVFHSKAKNTPRTFDFTCAQYTDEINRLLGEKELNPNYWVVSDSKASYKGGTYWIDLDTDLDSKKIKKITVGPADLEDGIKMASVSLMAVDESQTQKTALDTLALYKDVNLNVFVFEANENRLPKQLSAVGAALTQTTTPQPVSTYEPPPPSVIVEPPTTTQPQTEDPKASAYRAYLTHLENNRSWFVDYKDNAYSGKRFEHIIAFKDLNGDGVEEMIYLKAPEENQLRVYLCILTYQDGSVTTLYEDLFVTFAGAECGYDIYIGNDGKLYHILSHFPNSSAYLYSVDGNTVSATCLANTYGVGTGNPDIDYYIDGKDVSQEAYKSYIENMRSGIATYLSYYHGMGTNPGTDDISLDYDRACNFLRSNI